MPSERICFGKPEIMTEMLNQLFDEKFPELVIKEEGDGGSTATADTAEKATVSPSFA